MLQSQNECSSFNYRTILVWWRKQHRNNYPHELHVIKSTHLWILNANFADPQIGLSFFFLRPETLLLIFTWSSWCLPTPLGRFPDIYFGVRASRLLLDKEDIISNRIRINHDAQLCRVLCSVKSEIKQENKLSHSLLAQTHDDLPIELMRDTAMAYNFFLLFFQYKVNK